MAATWQVAAALPGALPQEHQHDLFSAVSQVLDTPLQMEGGHLIVPQRPGIGVDVNEMAVRAVTSEHWIVDDGGRRRGDGAH
jgi:L-alanine-DL-glutamate epimerase-like enolase superfamily enzyme